MNAKTVQALIDGMSAQWMRERSESQMTLGKLIKRLEELPPETPVGIGNPHSYRGYYSDLAFDPAISTAAEALARCRAAMGEVFQGYKGGDFQMGSLTPVWIAHYGDCGKKIVAVADDGTLELREDNAQ